MDAQDAPRGLYDKLVTRGFRDVLDALADRGLHVHREAVDPAEAHEYLARHLASVVSTTLRGVPSTQRPQAQIELVNALVRRLLELDGTADADETVSQAGEILTAVHDPLPPGATGPTRPHIALSQNDLLVNGRDEPAIGRELADELESADRVDVLIAFVRWYGIRIIRDELEEALHRGVPVRLITTTYLGSTERRAIDWLVERGAHVKVSYDTRTTRLHAKAWIFHRGTGFTTAYIGSSNLSKSALLDGLEWNVRIAEAASPQLIEKFTATFNSYWESEEFEAYDPDRDAERFDAAVDTEDGGDGIDISGLQLRAWPYQREILEALDAERLRHDRWDNLVVAPTGTGKTVVAALDYRRLQDHFDRDPSLLFVAHRQRILEQSRRVFREALRDGSFGELLVGGHRPQDWKHVFASIQSLHAMDVTELDPDMFDIVIVDEFHHAEAPTYARALNHLEPKVLLGLTATPERTDGTNVKRWFGDRYAFEMRLWDALDQRLLAPFQYFGVSDDVDLSQLRWTRGGYHQGELSNVYTGHDARTEKILQALRDIVADVPSMRAFGFCVSVDHARYMARRFNEAGIRSVALTGETPEEERIRVLNDLASNRDDRIRVVFGVDVLTEGIDVPELDTIVLLRPTESATVFLQQIGRGLRKTAGKACCTILDFIGQQRREFRFDLRLRALTGASRRELEDRVDEGFPFLPAGCHIQLDRQSSQIILDNIKRALRVTNQTLVPELRRIVEDRGEPDLATFLDEVGAELHELYKPSIGGWSALRRRAELEMPAEGPDEDQLARAIGRHLHVDDVERLNLYRSILGQSEPPSVEAFDVRQRRLLTMLHFSLWGVGKDAPRSLEDSYRRLWQHPALLDDLQQVFAILDEETGYLTRELSDLPEVPLAIHGTYGREEILAAFDRIPVEEPYSFREGVLYDEATSTDMFLVTLRKAEKHYSPSTMYEDYAISPELFHWQSQSTTSQESPVGRRYLSGSSRVLLFVRDEREGPNGAAPYLCLGPASFVDAKGDRPISITWKLQVAMPQDFFQRARLAAS